MTGGQLGAYGTLHSYLWSEELWEDWYSVTKILCEEAVCETCEG